VLKAKDNCRTRDFEDDYDGDSSDNDYTEDEEVSEEVIGKLHEFFICV